MTLPEDFINYTKALTGNELWSIISRGLADEPPVSIRINPFKCASGSPAESLSDGKVGWCDSGYYLNSRPNFTFDPLLHAGLYYVQEASSMFLDRVMRQYASDGALTMLDLCAAPGGKSTVARAALPEGSLLISNEPMRTRAQILAENMQKFGHEDVIVTNNYPRDFGKSRLMFDVILTDVPCSGEGMFRKDDTAISEWSVQNVEKCWRLQREIVSDVWQCLKPGGLLIYSTCTFNTKEDEENIRYITEELGAELLPVDIDDSWKITGSLLSGFDKPVYRFLPGLTRGEGIFMAVMRKNGERDANDTPRKDKKAKKDKQRNSKKETASCNRNWIKDPDRFDFVTSDNITAAIPKAWRDVYDAAAKSLKILSAGITIGENKGKDIIPAQALALSRALNKETFAQAELNYTQAMSFLRKEAVTLPADTPRGYVLVEFNGVPLGFEKNIGNRANNLYPAEWKVKSSHVPDEYNEIIRTK